MEVNKDYISELLSRTNEALEGANSATDLSNHSMAIAVAELAEQLEEALGALNSDNGSTIRSLHHFACTGGTLFSRCLAASPNYVLFSEIDPLGTHHLPDKKRPFFPTDLLADLHYSPREISQSTIVEAFLSTLSSLHENLRKKGLNILIRDHAHSQFCTNKDPKIRPTLKEILSKRFKTNSAVTVRHPLDSFVALDANLWHHFSPFTLDSYSERYIEFLNFYNNVPIFKYEDFTSSPEAILSEMCDRLEMPMSQSFDYFQNAFTTSGNSGRKSIDIKARPRRSIPDEIESQRDQPNYLQLCQLLDYEP